MYIFDHGGKVSLTRKSPRPSCGVRVLIGDVVFSTTSLVGVLKKNICLREPVFNCVENDLCLAVFREHGLAKIYDLTLAPTQKPSWESLNSTCLAGPQVPQRDIITEQAHKEQAFGPT